MKAIVKNTLLAFVLISVGFALGKEVTARRQVPADTMGLVPGGDKIVVYYLHTTFRCVTCNEIERLTKALLDTEFTDDLAAGRVEWREANFQQDESLAKRYEVVSSCVVVVQVRGGKEAAYQRLDDVWTRYQDPAGFNEYVGLAIKKYLREMGGME